MDEGLGHRILRPHFHRCTTQKYFIHFSFSYTECLLKRFETMRWLPARDKFLLFSAPCHLLYGGVRILSLVFFLLVRHCFVLPFFILCSFFGLHSANDFHAIRFDSKAKVRMSLRFLYAFFIFILSLTPSTAPEWGITLFMIIPNAVILIECLRSRLRSIHFINWPECYFVVFSLNAPFVIRVVGLCNFGLICMRGALHFVNGVTMWEIDKHFARTHKQKCHYITASLAIAVGNWVVQSKWKYFNYVDFICKKSLINSNGCYKRFCRESRMNSSNFADFWSKTMDSAENIPRRRSENDLSLFWL